MFAVRLGQLVIVVLLVGCGALLGVGSSSSVGWADGAGAERFGLVPRCRTGEGDCADVAERVIVDVLLANLGGPATNTVITDFGGPRTEPAGGIETLDIQYSHDPPVSWRAMAADGSTATGTTTQVVVDLAPFVRGTGQAYALVERNGQPTALQVPDAIARQLLDAVYVPRR